MYRTGMDMSDVSKAVASVILADIVLEALLANCCKQQRPHNMTALVSTSCDNLPVAVCCSSKVTRSSLG